MSSRIKFSSSFAQTSGTMRSSTNMADKIVMYQLFEDFVDAGDKNIYSADPTLPLILIVWEYIDKERVIRPKIDGFVEIIIPIMSKTEFRRHFRVCFDVYQHLLNDLTPTLTKNYHGGHFPVSPDKKILMFLWYAANQYSQREIGMMFGTGEWAVNTYIKEVKEIICRHSARYIKWPNIQRENDISRSFYDLCGIRNIVGAVDGTHIPIVNSPGGNADYINRKGFASIQLQLVVDDTLMINSAYVGWPGSTHDTRVLRNSTFFDDTEQGRKITLHQGNLFSGTVLTL